MDWNAAYRSSSHVESDGAGKILSLSPDLHREAVAFDAPLLKPLRFREAISALHDVVTSDLRFQPRDHAAYEAWKKARDDEILALRRRVLTEAHSQVNAARETPISRELKLAYRVARKEYWRARRGHIRWLYWNDPALWRQIVPLDPIVTVAPDIVLFECFSADESSYGALSVDRDGGFGPVANERLGTTNVDYSRELHEHFQTLRTYRETRLRVDPAGFEVAVDSASHREEKIALPNDWLRGFLELQGTATLTSHRVTLSREAVYSVLAWNRRHRARRSPRALRFELVPGEPPRLVLEPWERAVVSWGTRYDGPPTAPIRVWGHRRLAALARVLPLTERVDVHLAGTGLPSFWIARLGEMAFTLGLSGWTANDWTRATAIDLLAPPIAVQAGDLDAVRSALASKRRASAGELASASQRDLPTTHAALRDLARRGQVVRDFAADCMRLRQALPFDLDAPPASDHPELAASRELTLAVTTVDSRPLGDGRVVVSARVQDHAVEALLDQDHTIRRGKCICKHHRRFGLRRGPCRHLLALRARVWREMHANG